MVARPLQARARATGRRRRRPPRSSCTRGPTALRFLDTVRTGLAGALVAALLLATVLSYVVARTMTRPLAAVTDAMRDVAATGDLTRTRHGAEPRLGRRGRTAARLRLQHAHRVDRARSSARRPSASGCRRSGRLSTVIAHEIRNPLMIIRASLSRCAASGPGDDMREAVSRHRRGNASAEPARHRGPRLRQAAALRPRRGQPQRRVPRVGHGGVGRGLSGRCRPRPRPGAAAGVTDAERLRTALVNILGNARHAVEASPRARRRRAARRAVRMSCVKTVSRRRARA